MNRRSAKIKNLYDSPIAASTVEYLFDLCRLGKHQDKDSIQLLDFGCGNGRYLDAFATQIPPDNLKGVEIDIDRVAEVNRKGYKCWKLEPQSADLPFEDHTFDLVFSSNVIEHIQRHIYLNYLKEIHRILVPGGLFILGTPNYPIKRFYDMKKALTSSYFRYYFFDDPTHCNKLSFSRLESDLIPIFSKVELWPSYIFFQNAISVLKNPEVRQQLRVLGDKIAGRCTK